MRPISLFDTVIIFFGLSFCASTALAASKSATWTDNNYVPCEGIGASGTGQILVDIDFTDNAGVLRVSSLRVRSKYLHSHQSSARITFRRPTGASGFVNLQEPWFPTVGADDSSKTLYLPPAGSASGAAAQTAFEMKSGTSIEVALNARFPQQGGNCFSSFKNTLILP